MRLIFTQLIKKRAQSLRDLANVFIKRGDGCFSVTQTDRHGGIILRLKISNQSHHDLRKRLTHQNLIRGGKVQKWFDIAMK